MGILSAFDRASGLFARRQARRRPGFRYAGEAPLRAEIFSPVQLDAHARAMAASHRADPKPGPEKLLHRLAENEAVVRESHRIVSEAVRRSRRLPQAAEWLLDNFYLIEEQIAVARDVFPSGYSRELPRLRAGPLKGFPRVYDLALELVAHTDGRVDVDNLTRFVQAYQTVEPLNLGELWALPVMVRLALIENLRRVANRFALRRLDHVLAREWAGRFVAAASQSPEALITELAEFVRSNPPMSAPFIAEFIANVEGESPALGLVINWIEQKLSERGQTIELIQRAESREEAADQVSIGSSITSLRRIGALTWREFVESLSVTEAALRRDPLGVYDQMDFKTRDKYRHVVETLAKGSAFRQEEVAEAAVRLAAERRKAGVEQRESHVGWFLLDEGRAELEREVAYRPPLSRRIARIFAAAPVATYLLSILVLTAILTAPLFLAMRHNLRAPWAWAMLGIAASLIALSRPAVTFVNWIATACARRRRLPRLDFSEGVPDEHRTIVVVPTFLDSPEGAESLVENLEIRCLANRLPNLLFALLTDFPDAAEENLPGDQASVDAAIAGIRRLNQRYASGGEIPFLLLHRPRQWNPVERRWMGYERKRGKLEQLNRLVREGARETFSVIEGDVEALRTVKYVITLDADTQLPPDTAWKMIGALAHPLNRPRINPATRCVEKGYGILQPRLAASLVDAQKSAYSRLFAGEVGLDPYTGEAADIYQDLFGCGAFAGKGIYDVQAFHATLGGRFPDNRILSHDLIEGCHARCGILNDVELIEGHPFSFLADMSRRRRWVRGDWQIARWLLGSAPRADGKRMSNPLKLLARWMIGDNLRRSVIPAALLATLIFGVFALPEFALPWTGLLLLLYLMPDVIRVVVLLPAKKKRVSWRVHLGSVARQLGRSWAIELFQLAVLPYPAIAYLDAIARTLWRLCASGRGLLEWQTASDAERKQRSGGWATMAAMWPCPALAVAAGGAAAAIGIRSAEWLAAIPALWFVSPFLAWIISRPAERRAPPLTADQRLFLRKLARRTWGYFEHFVVEEQSWLPADNFQEQPDPRIAGRTSPTNIGMALLSDLAACDLGYASGRRLIERTERCFGTLDKLERHHGHFLNWFGTRTLQPLLPRYVSTVDSGNFVACLLTLKEGLNELPHMPILPERWREGIEDVVDVALDEIAAVLESSAAASRPVELTAARDLLQKQLAVLAQTPATLPAIRKALDFFSSALAALEPGVASWDGVAFWLAAARRQCEDLRDELIHFAPWLDLPEWAAAEVSHPAPDARFEAVRKALASVPSLEDIAALSDQLALLPTDALKQAVATAGARAAERMGAIGKLAAQCAGFAEMELDFLYAPMRGLLALGFNVDTQRRDGGCFDLLASEARLGSFVGIALGLLPVEHWFRLNRPLAPGGGHGVLLSWAGTMFEYLMPPLLMPTFPGTLLDATCRGAVRRQMEYGRTRGIPWGVSESCYNEVDAQMTYQYREFGVPGLGLKRGLADDLVVAPYAGALALMFAPQEACRNLESLAQLGAVGRFGLYEAMDFTPARLQEGERVAVVRAYMAHHSGMIMLSLVSVLADQPMQRRFLTEPRMRASALLLQERIPLAGAVTSAAEAAGEKTKGRRMPKSAGPAARSFTTAATPVPEVHLLSSGRYHLTVTNSGGGFSRWENLALTRWREDATCDNWGTFFYFCDVDSGRVWSSTWQPMAQGFDRYEVTFAQGMAEFQSLREEIGIRTQIAVSPETDLELRRMTITNHTDRVRTLEVTSYTEPVLLDPMTEAEHPCFHGLFGKTEVLPAKAAVLYTRRARAADERSPWLFHAMLLRGTPIEQDTSCETNRLKFLGRGRTARFPVAVTAPGPLSNTDGYVLDPALAIRRRIRLKPRESVVMDAVFGVAPSRDEALAALEKCQDRRSIERGIEMARAHSQILLHQLRADESDAQLFGALAGSVLYANAGRRAGAGQVARNRKGQSALWSYGISGDLPIVLLRVADEAGLDLVRHVLQAHTYWRHKGLQADLVIWAETYTGYRQSLADAIVGLVHAGAEAKALNQPAHRTGGQGGVFVRNLDQVPEEDRALFLAVARIVLSDRAGALADQVRRGRPSDTGSLPPLKARRGPTPRPPRRASPPREEEPPARELRHFNGLGGFTPDGREYVVMMKPGVQTPMPWVNVLANPQFGSVVSESGSAYTWRLNAHELRLTPWYNDPVTDVGGEAFYMRDELSGRFWPLTPGAGAVSGPYVCRHGLGYTAFEHRTDGWAAEMTTFVAVDAPVKLTSILLRNLGTDLRRVSVTGFCEWVLGDRRPKQAMHIVTRLEPQTGAILASNAFADAIPPCVAFFGCSQPDRSFTADRTEFIGRNGTPASPEALQRERLSNRVGARMDPCAAIQAYVVIPPGEERRVVFALGAAENEDRARALLQEFGGVDGAGQALEAVWEFWKRQLGGVYVETPDSTVNFLVNHWLLYQTLTARFWGRSGYYQSGGAFGFRDQLQDSLAFLWELPSLTRQHLLAAAGRQFVAGDVQHWWHPPAGRGVRTRISDDLLWLPYVTCRYVEATEDAAILDEQVPFLEGRPLAEAEESYYEQPRESEQRAPLYEHCVRAIRHALRLGPHGLPLMGSGDWNDGMNRVGHKGQGESVWLAFFLYDVLRKFSGLAARRGDSEFAQTCETAAAELQQKIEESAWDGEWYLRAFFDDGSPLGSSKNPECRIDVLPQSWAVLSGAATPERAAQAMQSVLDHLVDADLRLVRLLAPPFDKAALDPGYIKGYAPGVRENGGQYSHAAVWAALAFAKLHHADRAWELLDMINPIRRAETAAQAATYRVEPYVVAADIYTAAGHEGRGGWTWYTGSASWTYQLLVGELLGLKIQGATLSFAPIFRADWSQFTIHYRYQDTFYHIKLTKAGPETWNIRRLLVDNAEQPDLKVHMVNDSKEHAVQVEAG